MNAFETNYLRFLRITKVIFDGKKVPSRNIFLLDLETSQQSSASENRVFVFRRRMQDDKEG